MKPYRLPGMVLNSLLVVPLGAIIGLVWANTGPESYYRVAQALSFPVNEIGLAFLFAVLTKEVVEATLPGGVLHTWRRLALPLVAAIGGVAVPVAVFLLYLVQLGEPMLQQAWLTTCAIDVAACYLVGGLIFGRHPAMPFLLLMALASNALGLAIMSSLTPEPAEHIAIGLTIVLVSVAGALGLRRASVKSFWPYLLMGVPSWFGFYLAGLHPALALVPIVPFMPHALRDDHELLADPSPKARDALSRFERWWAPPLHGVLLLFGIVNAGVPVHGLEAGSWSLPIATIIGRPIGVLLWSEAAVAMGLHRTPRVGWRELIVIGCVGSIGLTMALFFATALLPIGWLVLQMKTGALLTALAALVAMLSARALRVGRFRRSIPKSLPRTLP
jgi:NhaA family Na+:H+ antiporter